MVYLFPLCTIAAAAVGMLCGIVARYMDAAARREEAAELQFRLCRLVSETARLPRTIAYLERIAEQNEARGYRIDARNCRAGIVNRRVQIARMLVEADALRSLILQTKAA